MSPRQSLPLLWLLSDARNDDRLEEALAALPAASGFVFRHYHLPESARRQRFDRLRRAGGGDIVFLLSASLDKAREWGAEGAYGTPQRLGARNGLLSLATAHNGEEIAAAERGGADGVFLSPVFETRSHPRARPLGIHGFHVLAQQARIPVIALGGMTKARAQDLHWPRWGAIDGLASPQAA